MELQELNIPVEEAYRMVLKYFWLTNPTDQNWKTKFQEVFSISVDQFYEIFGDYTNDNTNVLPSQSLTIESIF